MRRKTTEVISKVDWRVWAAFSIAIAFLAIGFLTYTNSVKADINEDITKRANASDTRAKKYEKDLATTNEKLASLATNLTAQIRQFQLCKKEPDAKGCEKPVAPPASAIVNQEGKESATPSLASLLVLARQARDEFCAVERCTGKDGRTPTEADLLRLIAPLVQQGIADWCGARNDCIGKDGEKGDKGDQGEVGPEGPAGPACPDGFVREETTVVTNGGPETILVCRAAPPQQEGA